MLPWGEELHSIEHMYSNIDFYALVSKLSTKNCWKYDSSAFNARICRRRHFFNPLQRRHPLCMCLSVLVTTVPMYLYAICSNGNHI